MDARGCVVCVCVGCMWGEVAIEGVHRRVLCAHGDMGAVGAPTCFCSAQTKQQPTLPACWPPSRAPLLSAAKFVPGCYALALTTEIPREVEEILESNNITWHKIVRRAPALLVGAAACSWVAVFFIAPPAFCTQPWVWIEGWDGYCTERLCARECGAAPSSVASVCISSDHHLSIYALSFFPPDDLFTRTHLHHHHHHHRRATSWRLLVPQP